jgi:hypothetical protein
MGQKRDSAELPSACHFTIQSFMIGVAIFARLLAVPVGLREVVALLLLPCLGLFMAWRHLADE